MKLAERFTRIGAGTIEYAFTVADPETWMSPLTANPPWYLSTARSTSMPATKATTAWNNLSAARAAEAKSK